MLLSRIIIGIYSLFSQVGTPATVPFATIFLNLSMTVLVPLILGQVSCVVVIKITKQIVHVCSGFQALSQTFRCRSNNPKSFIYSARNFLLAENS